MKAIAALLLAALLLAGCRSQPAEHKYQLYIFGTLLDITIFDADKDKTDRLVAELSTQFQRMHKEWHAWKPGGQLTALNAAFRQGRAMKVSPEIVGLIKDAARFERLSSGRFNPAIGALIDLWGFHSDEKPSGPPPAADKIAALVAAHPSMRDVIIDGNTVSSTNKLVQLDFGGFAKGSALDIAVAYLKKNGIENAILNAGGGLAVIGRHGKRAWQVGIRNPTNWGIIARLALGPDEALHTSGNYHRFREYEGLKYSHIIDPATGWPVEHIVSASVVAKAGDLADAAATALTVAGPKHWLGVARSMGINEALLVDDKGGLHVTPLMKKRLTFETGNPIVEVADPNAETQN